MRDRRTLLADVAVAAPVLVALALFLRDLVSPPTEWATLLERTRAWAELYRPGLLSTWWVVATIGALVAVGVCAAFLARGDPGDGRGTPG